MKKSLITIFVFGLLLFSCQKSKPKHPTNGLITYYSEQKGNSNIFIMKADGTQKYQLTNDKTKNQSGIWSPDGKQMIFSSERDGNSEIYIMDAYGNNPKRLTMNNTPDYNQSWSPDSKQIVYVSNEDGNQEIYTMNADGSNKTNITNSEINEMFPCWSPDGKFILYCSEENEGWKIYRMDVQGENREKVSENRSSDWELNPQFSPNGNKIAYVIYKPEKQNKNIFVMNKNGENSVQLTNSDFVDENPFWSPDGKYMVFQSNRSGNYQIYTMKTDGTEQKCLSNNSNSEFWPSWSQIQEF